jgi:hypothetical protein
MPSRCSRFRAPVMMFDAGRMAGRPGDGAALTICRKSGSLFFIARTFQREYLLLQMQK